MGGLAHQEKIQAIGKQAQGFHPKRKAFGKVNFKMPSRPAAQYRLSRLCRGEQGGHGEGISSRQWRVYKTRVDERDADTVRMLIQVQGFCQIDERRLGRTVGQTLGQSAVARDASNQTDMARTLLSHQRNDVL